MQEVMSKCVCVCVSRLLLILALSGRVKVLQYTLQVLKGGPVLRLVLPAFQHDVIELLRAGVQTLHTVSSLQSTDHLRICHT